MASSILELVVGWGGPPQWGAHKRLSTSTPLVKDGQRRHRLNSRPFGGKLRHFGVIPGDGQRGQRLSEGSFG